MTTLALLRHGQSTWNLENRFTGWVDVDLTEKGEAEARRAGELMGASGVEFSRAFASVQKRAIRTLWLALERMDRVYLPVEKNWRLNERFYGGLTGLNKSETAAKYGADQVKIWRRSYDTPPPPLDEADPNHPSHDPRYADVDPALLPNTESLKSTLERVEPYWRAAIAPKLTSGENVIVAAHGNSLRALVKILFAVADSDIVNVEIPTGNPLLVSLAPGATRVESARYLDDERAAALPLTPA